MTSIGSVAFRGCSGLTSVIIGSGVTSIRSEVFKDCSSLTSVTIPESVTSIGSQAFYNCSGLTSISIPNSVTSIDNYAFNSCSSLTSVTIGNGVTNIGENAFRYCKGLVELTCLAENIPTTGGDIFYNVSLSDKTLYVPSSAVDAYKAANYWKEFGSILSLEDKEAGIRAKGACGENVNYVLTLDSVLTISGEGAMTDYSSSSSMPWYNCRAAIKSVVMKDGVTSIGNYAFDYFSGLTSIIIPNSVTSIGSHAFYNCSGLTSVTIPNGVTSIGGSAFSGCSNLTKAEFSSIESLCNIQFGNEYSNPLYYAKHLYTGEQEITSLVTPESVTSIGNYAFYNCSGLKSVTISNNLTTIGKSAFYGCTGLVFVNIGNGVTSIGGYAFYGCTGLAEVNCAAEKVPTMGNNVFSNSNQANATLYVPASVVDAYKAANYWKGFGKILGAYVDATSVALDVTEATLQVGGTLTLTATVLPVDAIQTVKWSSSNTDVATVSDKGLVKAVGPGKAIVTATTTDGTELSASCEVTVSDEIASGSCGEGVNYVLRADYTLTISGTGAMTNYSTRFTNKAPWYDYCSAIKSVVIEDGVTGIGNYAFSGCSGLTSVTIPNSVTSIGSYAFERCFGLTSVIIGSGVTSIGRSAFYDCYGLTKAEFASIESLCGISFTDSSNPLIYAHHLYVDGIEVNDVVIPESVTSIGDRAFYGCSSLTSVTIPNSVTNIGNDAFYGCSGLTSVTIPNSVTSIGDYAFGFCSGLTSVIIGSGVSSIGNGAFSGCSGLTSITIPEGVTSIGRYAFSRCSDLTSVNIPESVTSIGYYAFERCSGLESITIPDNVTSIRDYAFSYCSSLTSITIPNSVTSIGDWAFSYCSNLTSVISEIEEPFTFGNEAFSGISSECILTVPAGKKEAYIAQGWTTSVFQGGIIEDAASANYLTLTDASGLVGAQCVLPISMSNTESIKGIQFDLRLPDGVTVATNEYDEMMFTLTSRAHSPHTVSASRLSSNHYRVVVSSLSAKTFKDTEGVIMNVTLNVDKNLSIGDYGVNLFSIVLNTADNVSIMPNDVTATLSLSDVAPGDVNGDGNINVTDVGLIIDIILSDNFSREVLMTENDEESVEEIHEPQ